MSNQEEQIWNTRFNWEVRWQILVANATLTIPYIILELAEPSGIVLLGFTHQSSGINVWYFRNVRDEIVVLLL